MDFLIGSSFKAYLQIIHGQYDQSFCRVSDQLREVLFVMLP